MFFLREKPPKVEETQATGRDNSGRPGVSWKTVTWGERTEMARLGNSRKLGQPGGQGQVWSYHLSGGGGVWLPVEP